MNRLLGSIVAVFSLSINTGCKSAVPPEAPTQADVELDSLSPVSALLSDVAAKCATLPFVTDSASDYYTVPGVSGVEVRIVPAQKSNKFKFKHLADGKIIARLENRGSGNYAQLALYGAQGRSCWYVWEDDDGQIQSKFVSTREPFESPDTRFGIDLHEGKHNGEKSKWKTDRDVGALPASGLFSFASFPIQGDTAASRGPWMWTTCLMNGCCRSRT